MASRKMLFWPHKKSINMNMNMNSNTNSNANSHALDGSKSQNGGLASRENDVLTSQNSVLASQKKIKNKYINSLTSYDLKAFLGLQKEISDIERAINAAYYPVKSPNMSGSLSNDPSDPTSSALYRIDKYKQQKEEKQKDLYELKKKIENELILLDPLTAAVLDLHFLKGLTWNETNIQLYKKSGDAARKIYKEWKKEKAE